MFFRFTSYVNDNAVNTIHMPFSGANREIIYPLVYEQAGGTDPDRYPEFDALYTLKMGKQQYHPITLSLTGFVVSMEIQMQTRRLSMRVR